MNVIIIEDEDYAVHRLKMLLEEIDKPITVVAILHGVNQAVRWLSSNTADLIFLDIHLSDGTAFKLFEQIDVRIPIIFTTAYHEYALRAFEQHSVDYLLKPINREKLQKSLEKFELLKGGNPDQSSMSKLLSLMQNLGNESKPKRLMIKVGNKVKIIDSVDVAFFVFDSKLTFAYTASQDRHLVDFSLKQLQLMLPQKEFFRVNRQYLVNRSCIEALIYLSKTRVKVNIKNYNHEVLVAREKLSTFKKWLME